MNRRTFSLSLAAAPCLLGVPLSLAQTPAPVIPETAGITFDEITDPTSEDLTRVSSLARVSRNVWGARGNTTFAGYDLNTGGPVITVVERGELFMVLLHTEWTGASGIAPLPRALLADNDYSPIVVVPETEMTLGAGDVVEMPFGTEGAKMGGPDMDDDETVSFLDVTFFPSDSILSLDIPELNMTSETLDINFGTATVNKPTPPCIVAGTLHLSAGSELSLKDIRTPLALYLEGGATTVNAVQEGGVYRDASLSQYETSTVLPSGEALDIVPNQMLYVPPSSTGTITASDDSVLMMVGLDLSAITVSGDGL